MSKVYFALPAAFSGPSIREMRLPICVRLFASGHLYSAIASPSFPLRNLLRGLGDRGANADIGAAAAEIAAEAALDLRRSRIWMLVEKCLASHDEARRAETALLRVVIDESLLHRVKIAVGRE